MNRERIHSVDTLKVFAILAIVGIHTHPFETYDEDLYYFLDKCFWFSVPLFFIISGFLLGKKVNSDPSNIKPIILNSCKRLLFLFVWWSIIYGILIGVYYSRGTEHTNPTELISILFTVFVNHVTNNPINFIFEGGMGILWFLTALALSQYTILFFHLLKKESLLIYFGCGLYIIGLLGGAYSLTPIGFGEFFMNPKYGPFFGTVFTILGWNASRYQADKETLFIKGLLLFLIGCVSYYLEWSMIYNKYFDAFWHDCVLGSIPLAYGIFLMALTMPALGKGTFLPKFGALTLGVYVTHQAFNGMFHTFKIQHPVGEVVYLIMIYTLALGCTYVLVRLPLVKQLVK